MANIKYVTPEKFNHLRIFDDENVSGLGTPSTEERYKVVDWVNVRAGMKHEYDKFDGQLFERDVLH